MKYLSYEDNFSLRIGQTCPEPAGPPVWTNCTHLYEKRLSKYHETIRFFYENFPNLIRVPTMNCKSVGKYSYTKNSREQTQITEYSRKVGESWRLCSSGLTMCSQSSTPAKEAADFHRTARHSIPQDRSHNRSHETLRSIKNAGFQEAKTNLQVQIRWNEQ